MCSDPNVRSATERSSGPISTCRPVHTAALRPNVKPAAMRQATATRWSTVKGPSKPDSSLPSLTSSARDRIPAPYKSAARLGRLPVFPNARTSMRSVWGRDANAAALAVLTACRNASESSQASAAMACTSSRRRGNSLSTFKSSNANPRCRSRSWDHSSVRDAIRRTSRSVGHARIALASICPSCGIRS